MKLFWPFFFILILSSQAKAQSLAATAHYPASAFVVNRMLPFVMTGQDGVEVQRVEVAPFENCSSMVDPFYKNTFHIYCRQAGLVDLQIFVKDSSGAPLDLSLQDLSIAFESPPNDGFEPVQETSAGGE